jgi:aspartate kinase
VSTVTVIKIGGSVLTGAAAYARAAVFVEGRLAEHPNERLVVVVSAEFGVTDRLLASALEIASDPDPATLDLLWSTGELRSAALLALHLQSRGVRATALNVHQTGLTEPDVHAGPGRMAIRSLRLSSALARHDVVVAPGFLARGDADAVVSLGRGGSDLTAVLLAAGLGARQCELVKDVPGYFSTDPNVDASAAHLPVVDFAQALAMADAGCDLVQRQALELARDRRLPLVVRAMDSPTRTIVSLTRTERSEPRRASAAK